MLNEVISVAIGDRSAQRQQADLDAADEKPDFDINRFRYLSKWRWGRWRRRSNMDHVQCFIVFVNIVNLCHLQRELCEQAIDRFKACSKLLMKLLIAILIGCTPLHLATD